MSDDTDTDEEVLSDLEIHRIYGIPLSVIQGITKLTDHFTQDYIDYKCNKPEVRDEYKGSNRIL